MNLLLLRMALHVRRTALHLRRMALHLRRMGLPLHLRRMGLLLHLLTKMILDLVQGKINLVRLPRKRGRPWGLALALVGSISLLGGRCCGSNAVFVGGSVPVSTN
jgi:hypothetical protein